MNVKIRNSKVFEKIKGQWIERPDLIAEESVDINGNVIHREIKKIENWKENSMKKIEPGDKIRIISAKGEIASNYINSIGEEHIVELVMDSYNNDGKKFLILKDSSLRPFLDNCELVKKRGELEAADLKNGDIVEFRNKKRYIKTKSCFVNIDTNELISTSLYDNYLFCSAFKDGSHDVMKILDMSEVYKNPKWSMEIEERKAEEMTLEEVCKELGREIKIIQ